MTRWLIPSLATLLATTAGSSIAETVYRCGNVYSQSPCAAGQSLDVADTRNAAERAEAKRIALAEQRLGDLMERQRLTAEASLRPAPAANLGSAPARAAVVVKPLPKKRRASRTWAPDDVVAVDPSTLRRKRSR